MTLLCPFQCPGRARVTLMQQGVDAQRRYPAGVPSDYLVGQLVSLGPGCMFTMCFADKAIRQGSFQY